MKIRYGKKKNQMFLPRIKYAMNVETNQKKNVSVLANSREYT